MTTMRLAEKESDIVKKVFLTGLALLFINGLMVAAARAQPMKGEEEQRLNHKLTNFPSGINSAFQTTFGRDATSAEMSQWVKSDRTVRELIKQLHEVLKSDAGANELQKTIGRGYATSFGREPTAKELAFWTAEAKAKSYGFDELVMAHHAWLKTPEADAERKSLVFRNFFEAYGRLPTVSESNGYHDEIEKLGMNYSELLAWIMDRMLLPATFIVAGEKREALVNELHDMIKRAFLTANKGQPSEAQYNEWTAKVQAQKLTFKQLVAVLKQQ
jgi:hypothetical protein